MGGVLKEVDGTECHVYKTGMNVGNQAHFYRMFVVPVIEDDRLGTTIVTAVGAVTVGDTTFDDCIRIEFTRADSSESYANGAVTYEYVEHTTFDPRSIAGTVTTDGSTPAVDAFV